MSRSNAFAWGSTSADSRPGATSDSKRLSTDEGRALLVSYVFWSTQVAASSSRPVPC